MNTFEVLVFLLCFLIHEWGHYLWAHKYGCKPEFVLKWYGMQVRGFYDKLRFSEYINVLLAGILIGLIPSILILGRENTPIFFIAYIGMSSVDILNILALSFKIIISGDRKLVDLPFLIQS